MTLATLLAHFVDWRVRERGRAYFQAGQVKLLVCRAGGWWRRWSPGRRITSTWSPCAREDASLWVFCSCPFFESGEPCKHVWAAVLAADDRKALRGLNGDLPRRLLTPGSAAGAPAAGCPCRPGGIPSISSR